MERRVDSTCVFAPCVFAVQQCLHCLLTNSAFFTAIVPYVVLSVHASSSPAMLGCLILVRTIHVWKSHSTWLMVLFPTLAAMAVGQLRRMLTPSENFVIWSLYWSCCLSIESASLSFGYTSVEVFDMGHSILFVQLALFIIISICSGTVLTVQCLRSVDRAGDYWLVRLSVCIAWIAAATASVDTISMFNWIFSFIACSKSHRVAILCGYWVIVIVLTVLASFELNSRPSIKKTIVRKLFHLSAFLLFVPAILVESLQSFLCLAMGLVLCLFIAFEFLRAFVFQGMNDPNTSGLLALGSYFLSFEQPEDLERRGGVVAAHLTLLLGCSYSLFVHASTFKWTGVVGAGRPLVALAVRLVPYLGIVSVCVADSAASVCGTLWGRITWQTGGKRTIVGSAAALLSMTGTCAALLAAEDVVNMKGMVLQHLSRGELFALIAMVLLTSIFTMVAEAFTTESDNLVLPCCSTLLYLALLVALKGA